MKLMTNVFFATFTLTVLFGNLRAHPGHTENEQPFQYPYDRDDSVDSHNHEEESENPEEQEKSNQHKKSQTEPE